MINNDEKNVYSKHSPLILGAQWSDEKQIPHHLDIDLNLATAKMISLTTRELKMSGCW